MDCCILAKLPAHIVVQAEIVLLLRFAHDLHCSFALRKRDTAQGSAGAIEERVGRGILRQRLGYGNTWHASVFISERHAAGNLHSATGFPPAFAPLLWLASSPEIRKNPLHP